MYQQLLYIAVYNIIMFHETFVILSMLNVVHVFLSMYSSVQYTENNIFLAQVVLTTNLSEKYISGSFSRL